MTNTTPVELYAEATPNPASMKFVSNRVLHNGVLDFQDAASAADSPFATQLFKFSFIKSVFISGNYVTISIHPGIEWFEVTSMLREFIRSYIESGDIISPEKSTIPGTLHPDFHGTAVEVRIQELLETYIRPAVEEDGGAILFKSFNEGVVKLELHGACSGCPSSTITLKSGIETLLKKMLPEVKEVVAE